jgi:hypothetical protein
MARGYRIPDDKRAEFRAEYLRTGSVSQSSESTGIALRTCFNLSRECEDDPDFLRARSRLRAGAIEEVELALRDCLRLAYVRAHSEPLTPQELAKIAVENGLKNFQFPDMGPQYIKCITDMHRSLTSNRKQLAADGSVNQEPTQIVINLATPPVGRGGDTAPGTDAGPSS